MFREEDFCFVRRLHQGFVARLGHEKAKIILNKEAERSHEMTTKRVDKYVMNAFKICYKDGETKIRTCDSYLTAAPNSETSPRRIAGRFGFINLVRKICGASNPPMRAIADELPSAQERK